MTSPEKTEAFLSALAEALELDSSALTPTTSFAEIDWDSLAVISAIALIDEHFGIMVPGQAISECPGIPVLLSLINSYLPD
jgi:acyl carrier protein